MNLKGNRSIKLTLTSIAFLFCIQGLFSRLDSSTFHRSGWRRQAQIISFGIGAPSDALNSFSKIRRTGETFTISSLSSSIVFHLKTEFFLKKHLGIVGTINYSSLHYDYDYSNLGKPPEKFKVDADIFSLHARLNYHLLHDKAIDVYLGAGTGIRLVMTRNNHNNVPDAYPSGPFQEYELTIGARYLVEGAWGVFAEAGLGRSVLQIGLSYNLRKW